MKKLSVAVVFLAMASASFAMGIFSIDVGGGYMFHSLTTTYDYAAFAPALKHELDSLFVSGGDITVESTEKYNCGTIGLDVSISYYYMGIDVGFPTSINIIGIDPSTALYDRTVDVHNADKVKTYVVDAKVCAGLPLNLSRLSFFFGVHADINYTKVTRNIKTPLYLSSTVISNIVDSTKTTLVGAGGIISLNYHFTPLIGIELVADYSFLFKPFSITRTLEGREEISGARVSYTIIDNKNKSGIKQRGHTFTIKLVFTF